MTAPDIPEDIRELAAKAIYEEEEAVAIMFGAMPPWDELDDHDKNHCRETADAAIKAIEPFIAAERTRATEEIEALKHDLDRYIAISTELATENEELRAASIRTEGTKP